MLAEIGNLSLIIALCLAAVQMLSFALQLLSWIQLTKSIESVDISTIPGKNRRFSVLRCSHTRVYAALRCSKINDSCLGLAKCQQTLAVGQILFVLCGFVILELCLLQDDFSVQFVAHNSNSSLPWYYKLTALWGAHEGSLLLWIFMLNLWILAVLLAARSWSQAFANKVLHVFGVLNFGLLLLLLKTSNPFLRYMPETPLDGADLNPLLQDFGMIIHPPILYLGYVGTAVPFALAIAVLLEGKVEAKFLIQMRSWVLSAWMFLTMGIALGSWWAYYELGWGGWWFWDPVENASFMPWLSATALLHCLTLSAKKPQFMPLVLFLAIATFALSLLGTFLVRSGVISSVHAFASDPQRGVFILQFLTIIVGGSLLLYSLRAASLRPAKATELKVFSTSGAILINNIILLIATATVLLGTLYPLGYELIFGQKISVGYPYFNAVFIPLMLLLFMVLLMTMLPNITLLFVITLATCCAAIILYLYFGKTVFNAILGLSFAFAIIFASVLAAYKQNIFKKPAMHLAHIGLAISVIGMSITPAYEIERDLKINVYDKLQIANYNIEFSGVDYIEGPNYLAQQGTFKINKNDKYIAELKPQKRVYLAQELPMTETAILPGIFADIYIALGQQLAQDQWSARIYYKPCVRFIWLGAIIMSFGALYGLINRRRKIYV